MPTDMQKALALVPTAQATATAVQSGRWSDPATWDVPPAVDGKVWIPAGKTVSQDIDTPRLKWLFVQGNFFPAVGAPVTLRVDTLVSDMGSLVAAGSEGIPFENQWNVIFADYGPLNPIADPWLFGRGWQCMGSVSLWGREVITTCMTTGNLHGTTIIHLTQPCTGWRVGDQIVYPGVGYNVQDDDVRTISAISPDLLTVTISSPLSFDHQAFDREGFPRPMFVGNVSKRSIDFSSENQTTIGQRGHLMFMKDPADVMTQHELHHISATQLGRTNKAVAVTDPDGLGGGLANARGRYAIHFHKCGPDLLDANGQPRMMSNVIGCLVIGSPGWGPTNHDSYCCFDSNLIWKVFAAGLVGETGPENGCVCDNRVVRLMAPVVTLANVIAQGTNADWGKFGHGLWTMAGGIQFQGVNIVTGAPNFAAVNMGIPFVLNGVTTMFATKNLPAPYTYAQQTCPAGYVPQNQSGIQFFGCAGGVVAWGLNSNGIPVPPIGRSLYSDISGECNDQVFMGGYQSNIDMLRIRGVRQAHDYAAGTAFLHSGVETDVSITDCSAYGYDTGVLAGNQLDIPITGFTGRNLANVVVSNLIYPSRNVTINNLTTLPLAPADLAIAVNSTNQYAYVRFRNNQNKQQVGVCLYPDQSGTSLYKTVAADGKNFSNFLYASGGMDCVGDSITLDGVPLFFQEQNDNWPLDKITNRPGIFAGKNSGQMWSQFQLAFGARRLPADSVQLAGHAAFYSPSGAAPTDLPAMQITKKTGAIGLFGGQYWQETNLLSGFVVQVKDSSGVFRYSAPQTFPVDKQWYVVFVTCDGMQRGVLVWCDSTKTPIASW